MVDLLAAAGHEVVAWRRPGGQPPVTTARASWQEVDVLDRKAVAEAVERTRPAMVYHCAGAAHVGRSWEATESTFAINVMGTHHVLDALARAGLPSPVLLPSSSMVYRPADRPLQEGDALVPPSPYGLSKLAQELLGLHAASSHVPVLIARAFNHVGPRQDPSFAASGFARQIAEIELGLREPEVLVGNLEARRDTIDVRDTVRAYRVILERGRPGHPYNICSGQAVATGDVLEMLTARARARIRVRVDPGRFRPNDAPVTVGDPSRLREELGWSPQIPFTTTLDDLLDFWRSTLRSERPITSDAP